MTLAERLVKAREGRGLSQGDAAAEAGITQAALSYLESGRKQPKASTLAALAKVYGQTMEHLLEGKN